MNIYIFVYIDITSIPPSFIAGHVIKNGGGKTNPPKRDIMGKGNHGSNFNHTSEGENGIYN
jgi:hypothetical protein